MKKIIALLLLLSASPCFAQDYQRQQLIQELTKSFQLRNELLQRELNRTSITQQALDNIWLQQQMQRSGQYYAPPVYIPPFQYNPNYSTGSNIGGAAATGLMQGILQGLGK